MQGGVGSGKSMVLGDLLVKFRSESINNKVAIAANTHKQLRDSTLAAISERLNMYGFKEGQDFSYSMANSTFDFLGMTCLLRTLENVDKAIAGITIHKWLLDEFAFAGRPSQTPEYIYKKLIQRMRAPSGGEDISHQLYAVTSPNGFNHCHDIWVKNKTKRHDIIYCKTKDNIFLPEDYYESMLEDYGGEDAALARQELFGEFVNIQQGKVYYAFDRDLHVTPLKRFGGTLFIMMDFNVNPMTATIGQYINNTLHCLDEVYLRDSNTIHMSQELIKRGYKGDVIPDSTGKNRKTSGSSDFEILKDHGFNVIPTHNPYVKDRVNAVNKAFLSGRIKIDPKCKNLIEDLEKVVWCGSDLDKRDPDRTHASDNLGYGTWKLIGISTRPKSSIVAFS